MYLIGLALADGHLDPAERNIIAEVAMALGMNRATLEHLIRMVNAQTHFRSGGGYTGQDGSRSYSQPTPKQELDLAYEALGVSKDISDKDLKRAYRKLMSENHPDKLIGQGVPDDMVEMATERSQEIQAAYDLICKHRKNSRFQIVGAIIIVIIGAWIAGKVGKLVEKLMLSREIDVTLSRFSGGVIKIILLVMVAIVALGNLGISVTPFIAAIGALGLGAGLAIQGMLANYAAGFTIIITRPFVVGDTVQVQSVTGIVESVHLGYTILVNEDDVRIQIPNRHIVGEIIHNSAENLLVELEIGSPVADADHSETVEDLSPNPLRNAVQSVVERPFDAETMALLLEAELSAYRGNLQRALTIYAELAQESQDPGLAKRYAEIALASEDLHALLDSSLLWYELTPDDLAAQQLGILALARMGETEGAWEIIARNADNHLSVRVLAAETHRAEYGAQMAWLYEKIAEFYGVRPNSSELLIALSILSEGMGLIEIAESYAAGASTISPKSILPVQLRANTLIQLQRPEDAVKVVSDYVLYSDAEQEDRIQMARLLASISQEAALPVFQQLSEEFPWAGDVQLSTAQLLLAQNRSEEAEQYYIRLTRMGEHRDLAHFNLGRIYESRGMLEPALDYYYKVESGDLEFEAKLRAALMLTARQPEQTVAEYEALFEKFPEEAPTIYHEHGRALATANRPQLALEIFSEGLEQHPGNQSLLYARSVTYESIDMIDEAVADLRAILKDDEENVSALNALGYTLANRTDKYAEAYLLIDHALALSPDDPAIIDSMGWVLYRLGRYEEALEYLERALAALFDEEILSHLVEVLVALDRTEDAQNLVEESLLQLPDSEMLQEWDERLNNPNG
eukprot:g16923.t1